MNRTTRDMILTAKVLLAERAKVVSALHTPGEFSDAMEAADQLASLSRSIGRIYERACSVPLTEAQGAAADKREAQLIAKAHALAKPYGVALRVQGDPRGLALSILTPASGRYNTMGGAESGWAV